jgi:hypothetical protein
MKKLAKQLSLYSKYWFIFLIGPISSYYSPWTVSLTTARQRQLRLLEVYHTYLGKQL